MKKLVLLALVGILVFAVTAGAVLAAPGQDRQRPQHWQQVNFTDAQKDELAKLQYKMLDLRKQMLQKYVEAGSITQEQANTRYNTMKANLDQAVKDGRVGMGMGMVMGMGRGGCGGAGPQNCPNFQGQAQVNQ